MPRRVYLLKRCSDSLITLGGERMMYHAGPVQLMLSKLLTEKT